MRKKSQPNIVVVTKETRLAKLKARWGTPDMAKFRLGQVHVHEADRQKARGTAEQVQAMGVAAGFDEYQSEADAYDQCIRQVRAEVEVGLPVKMLDRDMLSTFDFWNTSVVAVVGPDGLVANTAKYVGSIPIIGVNPDPRRIDGVLLPFDVKSVRAAVQSALQKEHRAESVSLAMAELNDGQSLLAFNDFFVGAQTHVSARYTVNFCGQFESHSSSGIIISTGGGATGWLSSMFNMAAGISSYADCEPPPPPVLNRGDQRLIWVVREPFKSRQTGARMVIGAIDNDQELVVESLMPRGGVIFSDGIEADFLEFNSGTIARITVAKERAQLVSRS